MSRCLLCSVFLGNIKEAFEWNPGLTNHLLDDFFKDAIHRDQVTYIICFCLLVCVSVCLSVYLSFFADLCLTCRHHGVKSVQWLSLLVSPLHASALLSPFTMATDQAACQLISSRHREITLVLTHMSCSPNPVNSSTPTGLATVVLSRHPLTLPDWSSVAIDINICFSIAVMLL